MYRYINSPSRARAAFALALSHSIHTSYSQWKCTTEKSLTILAAIRAQRQPTIQNRRKKKKNSKEMCSHMVWSERAAAPNRKSGGPISSTPSTYEIQHINIYCFRFIFDGFFPSRSVGRSFGRVVLATSPRSLYTR